MCPMSDLPLPLRVHEGQVDGEVYILGADEEPVVRVYGYTVKESMEYGAALVRAANLEPAYARCVEALDDAVITFRNYYASAISRHVMEEKLARYVEALTALRTVETEEERR